jgi:hypothetical protein
MRSSVMYSLVLRSSIILRDSIFLDISIFSRSSLAFSLASFVSLLASRVFSLTSRVFSSASLVFFLDPCFDFYLDRYLSGLFILLYPSSLSTLL